MTDLPDHADLAWRPLVRPDFPALARLSARSNTFDRTPWVWSEEEVTHDLSRPEVVPERDGVVGLDREGELRAFGLVDARSSASRLLRVMLFGEVDPEWRRRGIGTAVLRWSQLVGTRRAVEQAVGTEPSVPRLLAGFTEDRLADRAALFRKAGFEPVRYYAEMGRILGEDLPDVPRPEGIDIVPWESALDADTGDAHNEAFLDHWGSEPNTPEEWRHRHSEAPAFRGDLSRLALDDGRVVGYVLAHRYPAEDAMHGVSVAWLQTVGVRRAYRRRGIAASLIAASLEAFRDEGIERADLGVDTDNPTGAFGLYERLGFRPLRTNTMFGRYLPAPGA